MSIQTARRRAEELVGAVGIQCPPVDVNRIALHIGVPIIHMELDGDVSGLLTSRKGSSVIVVRKGDHENRKRFTIAHEIAHFYLNHQFEAGEHVHVDRGNYISLRGPRSSQGIDFKEIEANQFAAALLMPSGMVYAAAKQLNAASLYDFHVAKLAEQFRVSEQAMSLRLQALKLL
jgi:Zn-dependent peptidase ImmA (M78 family)